MQATLSDRSSVWLSTPGTTWCHSSGCLMSVARTALPDVTSARTRWPPMKPPAPATTATAGFDGLTFRLSLVESSLANAEAYVMTFDQLIGCEGLIGRFLGSSTSTRTRLVRHPGATYGRSR